MTSQANPSITCKKLNRAWQAFVANKPKKALKILKGRFILASEHKRQLNVVRCLQDYDYPALKKLSDFSLQEFALIASWNLLLEAYPHREVWWAKREFLASLLGSDYILDIDIETMSIELEGEKPKSGSRTLPIVYEQSNQLWPKLSRFSGLSLAARTLFIRTVKYVRPRTGLTETQRIKLQDMPNVKSALETLSKADLVDPDPKAANLLMGLTLKELKKFAFEHGIKSYGPKHRLIRSIVAQVEQPEIQALIDDILGDKSYLLPLTLDLPLLKKYVWAETHRLKLYLRWIQQIHCLEVAPKKITGIQSVRQTRSSYKPMEPWNWTLKADSDYSPMRGWKSIEKEMVREVWDADCDEILLKLVKKYAWDASVYIGEAITDHWPPGKLQDFVQACEKNKTRSHYKLLSQYGELRLTQMNVKVRKPRLLECANCGREFIEWSIRPSMAKRVSYKIQFCADCYKSVFWPSNDDARYEQIDDDTMLDKLYALAVAMDNVPMATFMRNPSFVTISGEKQVVIVKALLDMPPYKVYLKRFDSWLRALILAGVLEEGTQQTSRGIRCIAADGHECLSLAEKIVDDWLTDHNISHEKEPFYPYHVRLNPSGMRADWKVNDILIEYAGLMSEPEYAAKMETKKELAKEFGFSLIVIRPDDLLGLEQKLGHLCSVGDK